MRIGTHLAAAALLALLSPNPSHRSDTAPYHHSVAVANGAVVQAMVPQGVPPDAPASAYGMDVPLAYYDLSFTLSKRTGGISPPVQARIFAYMGLALYESVVGGMPRNRSIASSLRGVGPLSGNSGARYWPLVASAAMAEVMRGLWGDATNAAAQNVADIDSLERQIASGLHLPGSLARRSMDYGHAVGAAIYQTSLDDGEDRGYLRNFPAEYEPPECDGCWVPTAPGQIAMQPYWGTTVETFVLSSSAECDQGGPPAFSEEPGSGFYEQAFEVYRLVQNATPEQLTIARFWADGPGTISGPGHSIAITNQILVQERANLAVAAEAYARVGLAIGDAVTALFRDKYYYNLIRPVTYLQRVVDPTWLPVLPTPPFPEYPSAHSAQSAAAAVSLEALFGDEVAFVDHAHDLDGFAPRSFNRIYAAAEEAGISRLYAGIHFRSGNLDGQALGRCVAAKVGALSWRRYGSGTRIAKRQAGARCARLT